MPDHIHLFIEADPFDSPNIVKIFKGVAGLGMSRKFADIVHKLWRGVIWSPSYYVETAGHVSAETIERCIYTADRVEAWFIYRLKPVVFPREIL
jgi:putative transposase